MTLSGLSCVMVSELNIVLRYVHLKQLPVRGNYGPPLWAITPQEKCVSIDRQTNNPVGGNIIIDALTFTYSAPERAPFGPKKKSTSIKLSRLLICRQIPNKDAIKDHRLCASQQWGREGDERPRRLSDGETEQRFSFRSVSGHLPSRPNSDTGGRSKLVVVALFSWAAYLATILMHVACMWHWRQLVSHACTANKWLESGERPFTACSEPHSYL